MARPEWNRIQITVERQTLGLGDSGGGSDGGTGAGLVVDLAGWLLNETYGRVVKHGVWDVSAHDPIATKYGGEELFSETVRGDERAAAVVRELVGRHADGGGVELRAPRRLRRHLQGL